MTEGYTPDGLPIISQETFEAFCAELKNPQKYVKTGSSLGTVFGKKLYEENHTLIDLLTEIQVMKQSDPVEAFIFGVACTYELLGRQSAANALKNEAEF